MKITEALLAEHQVFHNLFDHIEKTSPRLKTVAEVKLVADLAQTMLEAHSRTEDELFIGPLEHCFEQIGQRDTFHQEHEEIEEYLRRAKNAKQARAARQFLLSAIVLSRKHFDKEERVVFPLAERVLSARTLVELGRKWKEQRGEAANKG